ncbi:MAG: DsbA family protein [Acidimicrobiia bacterium]
MSLLEVYADVACPFTHVGLRRVAARRADLGRDDVVLRVRSWPLELVNGQPLDAAFIAEEVDVLRATVAPELFGGFREDAFPASSLPALDLAYAAYRVGDGVGERVSLALRTALFEDGRDVADPAVLAEIAAAHGVSVDPEADRAGVLADYEGGKTRGVRGSPEFFAGGEGWFCPVLDVRRVDGALQVTPDEATMVRFLDACFAG